MAKKILFFLDSLRAGGRERRAVELLTFIKKETDIVFQIVLVEEIIHYKNIFDLGIPIIILKKRFFKKDPLQFYRVFQIVKKFKPDIIHTWSAMTTFYTIPSLFYFNIPLINGQIANAFPIKYRSNFDNFLLKINRRVSSLILANSIAGLKAYNIKTKEGQVIYNGINLNRFKNLNGKKYIKSKFKINTEFTVIMVASFNGYKDYDLFFNIAKEVCMLRDDVSFLAVGEGVTKTTIFNEIKKCNRILLYDQILNVEELVNACDIGVLFSNMQTGEGISNAVMEYMALSKPVIATDAGGTKELVADNISGFLVKNNVELTIKVINKLLDNQNLSIQMGKKGREIIQNHFTIDKMGENFVEIYNSFFEK